MQPLSVGSAGVLACVAVACAGCGSAAAVPTTPPLPAPMVTVAPPTAKSITRFESFTGRTEPQEQVEIRSRVSGFLKKIYFQPGTEVEAGAPLFDIDPDLYDSALVKAQADVSRADALVKRLTADFNRSLNLVKTNVMPQAEFDQIAGNKLEAEASVAGLKALVKSAELNVGYTKIVAPISGEIGDRLVSEGNLVSGGQGGVTTLLAVIVSTDPMDVSFDVDETILQRIQQAVRDGNLKLARGSGIPVEMGLAIHGHDYPLHGVINFADNRVDTNTGTIRIKAQFDNPKPKAGERMLTAGMYARVRVPLGDAVPSLLVPDAALGSDQGAKFLYIIGPENKAVRLEAVVGEAQDGLRVIESVRGAVDDKPRQLKPDEQVIVSGLQRVRPGMIVDPKPAAKK